MQVKQWIVTIDYVETSGWEAAIEENGNYDDGGYEASDVATLLAAVGRDLAAEVASEEA